MLMTSYLQVTFTRETKKAEMKIFCLVYTCLYIYSTCSNLVILALIGFWFGLVFWLHSDSSCSMSNVVNPLNLTSLFKLQFRCVFKTIAKRLHCLIHVRVGMLLSLDIMLLQSSIQTGCPRCLWPSPLRTTPMVLMVLWSASCLVTPYGYYFLRNRCATR